MEKSFQINKKFKIRQNFRNKSMLQQFQYNYLYQTKIKNGFLISAFIF